ncbi:hypothetical protein Mgra_00008146 [Meloidogyne graminicola]|uniref:BPTI/Kunitz inhibitor domain-containing protein n=1 Tax=Meloidogyne graminicola TaxID=189291 RepID=A0A8S9ZGT7_9BILA|nr:hypothetical protein Mgra_00008146 [Meloidogyne graminicola]
MNKFILIIFLFFIFNLTTAFTPQRCYLPKIVGPCKAYFTRWWFNNGVCKEFIYGGCKGNDNNFKVYFKGKVYSKKDLQDI